jgi:hypothetical protein
LSLLGLCLRTLFGIVFAVAPRRQISIAFQFDVENCQRDSIDRQLLSRANAVFDITKSGHAVIFPRLFLLIEALGHVALPMKSIVVVHECIGHVCFHIDWPIDLDFGVAQSQVELIVFEAPTKKYLII